MTALEKHPLNVCGKYFVIQELCLDHACCVDLAPDNFKIAATDEPYGAYVCQQPDNEVAEARCREAMFCCPVEAIQIEEA